MNSSLVAAAISGRKEHHFIGNSMLTYSASLKELHKSGLDCLRGLAQVIEEHDHGLRGITELLKDPKRDPLRGGRGPRDYHTKPTKICGLMNRRVAVYKMDPDPAGDLFDDLGLPNTRRSD